MAATSAITSSEFIRLWSESGDLLLCDVRSPEEFRKGRLPESHNYPILNDEERRLVGLTYKKRGSQEAQKLGFELVGPSREHRVYQWDKFFKKAPESKRFVFCWRGGLRSKIVQEWLYEFSKERLLRIEGGYKEIRKELIQKNRTLPHFIILSGKTGSGKTRLLKRFSTKKTIDLEGLANHRGSSFGKHLRDTQPSQATFENSLYLELIRKSGHLLMEDESRLIGKSVLPNHIYTKKNESPRVLVDESLQSRSLRIFEEYVLEPSKQGVSGKALLGGFKNSLRSIQRKLGGLRFREVSKELEESFSVQRFPRFEDHNSWISKLLSYYYDPAYRHALEKKKHTVIFEGDLESCEVFLKDRLKFFEGI